MNGKIPPHSLDAESSVLGAILIDDKSFKKIGLTPDDFYKTAHQKIYRAMQVLKSRRETIDLLTMTDLLTKEGNIGEIGGATYLSSITNTMPTSAQIKTHAGIVKEKSQRRALMRSAIDVISNIEDADVDKLKAFVRAGLKETRTVGGVITARELATETSTYVEEISKSPNHIVGMPTGFHDVDKAMGGIKKTNLIIVAGRPGMGKSAFMGNIVLNVAKAGHPVGVFELEMGRTEIGIRHLSDIGKIPSLSLNQGFIKDYGEDFVQATRKLAELPIYYCFDGVITIDRIMQYVEGMVEDYGIKLVAIDYLQLITPAQKNRSREVEVAEISKTMKQIAKEYDVAVICLAQLNRGCEARDDKRPFLSDLRESGGIEQDADSVIFLYRDAYYKKDIDNTNEAECIFAKGRHMKTGAVKMQWQPEYTRFKSLAQGEEYGGSGY